MIEGLKLVQLTEVAGDDFCNCCFPLVVGFEVAGDDFCTRCLLPVRCVKCYTLGRSTHSYSVRVYGGAAIALCGQHVHSGFLLEGYFRHPTGGREMEGYQWNNCFVSCQKVEDPGRRPLRIQVAMRGAGRSLSDPTETYDGIRTIRWEGSR